MLFLGRPSALRRRRALLPDVLPWRLPALLGTGLLGSLALGTLLPWCLLSRRLLPGRLLSRRLLSWHLLSGCLLSIASLRITILWITILWITILRIAILGIAILGIAILRCLSADLAGIQFLGVILVGGSAGRSLKKHGFLCIGIACLFWGFIHIHTPSGGLARTHGHHCDSGDNQVIQEEKLGA